MYPEEIVAPMRKELTNLGFQELKTAQQVENKFKEEGTTLLVINSVCGCAAGSARPAVKQSLDTSTKTPSNLVTVFAGVDKQATDKAREYTLPFPPSSPAIVLFKNGEIVHMLERHHIEGRSAEMIADNLTEAYKEFC